MVEPVSYSAGKSRIQRPGPDSAGATGNVASPKAAAISLSGASSMNMGGASESISISIAAKAMPSELKAGPPVDIETVSKIREAIAENRYPIDLQAITESLFQSFLEISR